MLIVWLQLKNPDREAIYHQIDTPLKPIINSIFLHFNLQNTVGEIKQKNTFIQWLKGKSVMLINTV